ncbi:MAG: hypothetical protein D6705_07310 [Deltaproteobacteria bacterium]|nr:MAG: hypothetical protein D6705_07310 [Deltaproteobacteria bacterium]
MDEGEGVERLEHELGPRIGLDGRFGCRITHTAHEDDGDRGVGVSKASQCTGTRAVGESEIEENDVDAVALLA